MNRKAKKTASGQRSHKKMELYVRGRKIEVAEYPISRARSAYGLMEDTCKAILDEPKRYNQETFGNRIEHQEYFLSTDVDEYPKCGTVACVAGWMSVLRYGTVVDAANRAKIILGPIRSGDLFEGADMYDDDGEPLEIGTTEYARAGVRRIRKFMKKNEKRLKARRLPLLKKRLTRDGYER